MFYNKKKKNMSLSIETPNLLRSHTECGVHKHDICILYIYLLINYYFIFYDKRTQLFNIIH